MVRRAHRGFTYLTVLFIVAILGGGLALVGEMWETEARRDKEAELLFIGQQFRSAILRYYLSGPQRQYPRALEDLLQDARMPETRRYLRRVYADPMTGKAEWGMVKAPDGGILGVYSLSEEATFKRANFKRRDAAFAGAMKYSEWKFIAAVPVKPAAAKPGATPAPQPATRGTGT
ncbi:MAG: type II secretion system GspH family protein [Betaproteobacteria bacterium]|nr:type II secretion system GspH family protein [Betaproteobacteria bacterium]MDH4322764.1 type II secretion system GspH family protein [Betaproteobacteria bacterium]